MSWPTPQDYNEALQNPRLNFDDADLRAGEPETTPLGLPRPITGGFASVYRVRSGSRHWAVRCFLRDFSDYQERYAEIERHLAAAQLPYTVGFQFLVKGIRIRGHWHPVLKMEWIEGATFGETVEANINSPLAISSLAERWIAMLRALRKHTIAHGDLQHGNVLICDGDFRLIDYDGMFVPSFAGRTSHEVGHRNYQHPARTETDFGPHLDNFSGWVIYLTLIALSVDASLWTRFGAGEEHLLFRKEDFDEPRFSRLFRVLQHIKDDRIQKYLPLFGSYLEMPLSSIASPADVIGVPKKKREARRVSIPSWSRDSQIDLFSGKSRPDDRAVAVMEPESEIASLPVLDMPAVEAIDFSPSFASERIALGSYTAFILAIAALAARGTVPAMEAFFVFLAGLGCVAVCLTCSYVTLDEVRAKVRVWFALEWRRSQGDVVQYAATQLADWKSRVELKEFQKVRQLKTRDIQYVKQEKDRIAEVKRNLSSWIDELNLRIKALEQAEADETARELFRLQAQYDIVFQELSQLAAIPLQGFGRRQTKKLMACRKRRDELALAGPPKAIPAADRAAIRARYDLERQAVSRSKSFVRMRARSKIQNIRSARQHRQVRLKSQIERTELRYGRRKERLQRKVDAGKNWFMENRKEVTRHLVEMNRYRQIRFVRYLPRVLGFDL
jgi:hypothetical protein